MTVTQTGDFTFEVAFYCKEDALKLINNTESIEKNLEAKWDNTSAEASYIDSTTVELQVHVESECHVNEGSTGNRYEPPEPVTFDDMFSDSDVSSRLKSALSNSEYGFLAYDIETTDSSYDDEKTLLDRFDDLKYCA